METNEILNLGNTKKINLPDGNWIIIREQNGEDDDILSNLVTSRDGTNFAIFLAGIILESSFNSKRPLTVEDIMVWPLNNKYAALIHSRIHSLGNIVEFTHDFGNGPVHFEQDLNELIFDDYSMVPEESELMEKLEAIPYYPNGLKFIFEETLSSGKKIKYHLLNSMGEVKILNCPKEKFTKNLELIVRDLQLEVDGKWEMVQNFRMFSTKDMQEIRRSCNTNDPQYTGLISIYNPDTQQKEHIHIMGKPDFFFPGEM